MTSLEIHARGVTLHALERNPGGGPAVLFTHGWLDHCRGFDWLIDALPRSWRTIALDFRGHGLSGHVATGHYDISGYATDLDAALEHLRLEQVHLVGHSMGGAAALIYAAACPQRVLSLSLIEALGPTGGPPESAVARVQTFGAELRKPVQKRAYPSYEAALARVRENNSAFTEAMAAQMTKHGTRQTAAGWEFTFDPCVRRHTAVALGEDQILAVLGSVSVRTQLIHGKSGFAFDPDRLAARLAALKNPPMHAIEGGHHVHLDSPSEVAQKIQSFVESAT